VACTPNFARSVGVFCVSASCCILSKQLHHVLPLERKLISSLIGKSCRAKSLIFNEDELKSNILAFQIWAWALVSTSVYIRNGLAHVPTRIASVDKEFSRPLFTDVRHLRRAVWRVFRQKGPETTRWPWPPPWPRAESRWRARGPRPVLPAPSGCSPRVGC